jgi:hypothetical protein
MSDTPVTPPPPAPEPGPAADNSAPSTPFSIGEEYGTARKSLPPAGIVAICLVVVVAIAAIYALTHRAHALSSGSIDDVVAFPIPDQNMTMVAINLSLQNNEEKPSWIHTIKVDADMNGSKLSDDAVPATDAKRYFEAFPELKKNALELLTAETRMNPGSRLAGTIVVSFPVSGDQFAARKSLTVTVAPYNEVPVVITK